MGGCRGFLNRCSFIVGRKKRKTRDDRRETKKGVAPARYSLNCRAGGVDAARRQVSWYHAPSERCHGVDNETTHRR